MTDQPDKKVEWYAAAAPHEEAEIPDLPTDWSEKMAPAPQGGGEACYDEHQPGCDCEILPQVDHQQPSSLDRLAALKPQTPDVLGEAWISREDHEEAVREAQTLDKGFYEWLIERDLIARGDELDWGDIVVALTEHEIECATPPGDVLGGEGERDEALEWFLKVVASGGSQGVPAGDTWSVVNAFCDDRGDGDDTYNISESRKLTETWHSGFGDGSATVKITGAGKAYLQSLAARPSQSEEGEPG